jgi:hypothetical protein
MQLTREKGNTDPQSPGEDEDLVTDGDGEKNSSSSSNGSVASSNASSAAASSSGSSSSSKSAVAEAPGATCVTRYDSRVESSLLYSASAPGTPCVFGVDERDEGSHCIMEDEKYGSFGWCYTSTSKGSFGSCSEGCPLPGHYATLHGEIQSIRKTVFGEGENANSSASAVSNATGKSQASEAASEAASGATSTASSTASKKDLAKTPYAIKATGLEDWEKDYIIDDQPPDGTIGNFTSGASIYDSLPGLGIELNVPSWGSVKFFLYFALVMLISNLTVAYIHSSNTRTGILNTCGCRSFVCCCCFGGFLTLWQPIDPVGKAYQVK